MMVLFDNYAQSRGIRRKYVKVSLITTLMLLIISAIAPSVEAFSLGTSCKIQHLAHSKCQLQHYHTTKNIKSSSKSRSAQKARSCNMQLSFAPSLECELRTKTLQRQNGILNNGALLSLTDLLYRETYRGNSPKSGTRTTKLFLASLANEHNVTKDLEESDTSEELMQKIPLKEDEEFITAVKEVKVAAKNVTSSAGQLTTAIVSNGPGIIGRLLSSFICVEMRNDIIRRKATYISDWTDALDNKRQCIPAIIFLYFACLAPVVSFGTIASQITEGSIGVLEFLLASGAAGMGYSVLSGQPMAFIAPTGLTLAFISGLYRFCTNFNMAFFPVYTWVGLWTSGFMMLLGIRGASKSIRFCTRFTDEIFNGLLSFNFLYEAISSLRRNFLLADPLNLSMPFVSLSIALGTFWSTSKVIAFQTTIYFNEKLRKVLKDFGPAFIIIAFSGLNALPWVKKFGVPTLAVPSTFELAGGRQFLVPFLTVPKHIRMLCALPALLLTSLFFMDQNISVRVVNNPDNKLKKGAAYNLDMVALGFITAVLSIFGLPWMCGATVQSMNHVRAMTHMKFNETSNQVEVDDVVETRTTGFFVHAGILGTIGLLPKLRFLPIPVVSGVFLYLGRKLMSGNTFLKRITDAFAEGKRLPPSHPIHTLGRKKMNIFTAIQIGCLAALWGFKSNSATSIFFPSVIGMLMAIRYFALPKFFTEEELLALGDPTP